jgi:hypothetical protein
MKKLLTIVLAILPPIAGALGPLLWFRRKTRLKAAAARPKVEAMLDDLLRILSDHQGQLDKLIIVNEARTLNESLRQRDLYLKIGDVSYYLDVSIRLDGKKIGYVTVSIRHQRGDQVSTIAWPDHGEYFPPETWLTERVERLDTLAGDASRLRQALHRHPRFNGKDDGGGKKTN